MRLNALILIGIMILIPIMFSIVQAITGEAVTGEAITSHATANGVNLSIVVVSAAPSLALLNPKNQTYLRNETLLLNFTVSGQDFIFFNLDSGANTTITGSRFFNTTAGSHTLRLFANNSGGASSQSITFFVNLTKYNITYNEYSGNLKGQSTDFLLFSFEELQNLTNIVLENAEFGKIRLNQIINVTNDSISNSLTNIDSSTNISFNRIELNSTALPNFNVQSTLSLYNLTFSDPRVLRDGQVCSSSICTEESYSSGTFRFNVTGFSVYSAEETPAGAAGGGGGGRAAASSELISVSPEFMVVKLARGETKKEQITIKNSGSSSASVEIDLGAFEKFIKIKDYSFRIEAGEERVVELEFIAREDEIIGNYLGKISVIVEGKTRDISTSIEVFSKGALFDIEVDIPKNYLRVHPGDDLLANVRLFNLGSPGRVDVKIDYLIKEFETNLVILSEEETIAVETQVNVIKEFQIPKNAQIGNYIIQAKTTHYVDNTPLIASSSAFFAVTRRSLFSSDAPLGIISAIFSILSISIIILFIMILINIKIAKKMHYGKITAEDIVSSDESKNEILKAKEKKKRGMFSSLTKKFSDKKESFSEKLNIKEALKDYNILNAVIKSHIKISEKKPIKKRIAQSIKKLGERLE